MAERAAAEGRSSGEWGSAEWARSGEQDGDAVPVSDSRRGGAWTASGDFVSRPQVPSYASGLFRRDASAAPAEASSAGMFPAATTPAAVTPASLGTGPIVSPAPPSPADAPPADAPLLPPAAAAPQTTSGGGPARPMTRRELRALREAEARRGTAASRVARSQDAEAPDPGSQVAELHDGESLNAGPLNGGPQGIDPQGVDPQDADVQDARPQGGEPRASEASHPDAGSTEPAVADEPAAVLLGHAVGAGGTTTNALVLPRIPTPDNLTNPITSTGEILVTGSIHLPRSLGSTGSHPALYDRSEVDRLIEADDREDAEADSAPVSAIRAINTQTGRGVVMAKKTYGNRLLTVLTVVAAAMAVGVAGLFAASVIFKVF